jgi:hypothetical protein
MAGTGQSRKRPERCVDALAFAPRFDGGKRKRDVADLTARMVGVLTCKT